MEDSPAAAHYLNAQAPDFIVRRVKARFVYFSTDYVFDGRDGGYRETDLTRPINKYGKSKLAGERNVLAAGAHNVVLRVSGLLLIRMEPATVNSTIPVRLPSCRPTMIGSHRRFTSKMFGRH